MNRLIVKLNILKKVNCALRPLKENAPRCLTKKKYQHLALQLAKKTKKSTPITKFITRLQVTMKTEKSINAGKMVTYGHAVRPIGVRQVYFG